MAANPAIAGMAAPPQRRLVTLSLRFPDFDPATMQLLEVRKWGKPHKIGRRTINRHCRKRLEVQMDADESCASTSWKSSTELADPGRSTHGWLLAAPWASIVQEMRFGPLEASIECMTQENFAVLLLQACLQLDPEARPSCAELLTFPYFRGAASWFSPEFHCHQAPAVPL